MITVINTSNQTVNFKLNDESKKIVPNGKYTLSENEYASIKNFIDSLVIRNIVSIENSTNNQIETFRGEVKNIILTSQNTVFLLSNRIDMMQKELDSLIDTVNSLKESVAKKAVNIINVQESVSTVNDITERKFKIGKTF